jgi:hypothetical protein
VSTGLDPRVSERHLRAFMRLPVTMPAALVVRLSEKDLETLDKAGAREEYRGALADIVERLKRGHSERGAERHC